ncbi:alpha/beta fold hydrolase [Herbaspirillum robiniae]|uniref:alpha/beta fold hydrolase n=1 Tax=Herbaspirillum robiniae TaxID=2014887 RepID=UPI003D783F08
MKKISRAGSLLAVMAVLLCGCASAVKNYGPDEHFSETEAASGADSTPEQCARTSDAVWVAGPTFQECIRYFPSKDFRQGTVHSAIVFMAGDVLSAKGVSPSYAAGTPRKRIERADQEQRRGGTPYLILGRPGTDGSSGNQNLRRTRYETLVMNAALDKIKEKYGIAEYGLIGQSGGGGLVAALIAERQDVLCAVSSSGVTAVKYRIAAAGRSSDYTGKSVGDVWDPVEQLGRVNPMPGFRMFVTSDKNDGDVGYSSQEHYVLAAQKSGLPITQLMVHGTGPVHHQTYSIGNRVVEDCMLGLSTSYISTTYSDLSNDHPDMDGLARKAQTRRRLETASQGTAQPGNR